MYKWCFVMQLLRTHDVAVCSVVLCFILNLMPDVNSECVSLLLAGPSSCGIWRSSQWSAQWKETRLQSGEFTSEWNRLANVLL